MESCVRETTVTSTTTMPLAFATLPGMFTPLTVTVTGLPGTNEHGEATWRTRRCPTVKVPTSLVVLHAGGVGAVVVEVAAIVVDVVDGAVVDVVVEDVVVEDVVVEDVVVVVEEDVVVSWGIEPFTWAPNAEPDVAVTRAESPP